MLTLFKSKNQKGKRKFAAHYDSVDFQARRIEIQEKGNSSMETSRKFIEQITSSLSSYTDQFANVQLYCWDIRDECMAFEKYIELLIINKKQIINSWRPFITRSVLNLVDRHTTKSLIDKVILEIERLHNNQYPEKSKQFEVKVINYDLIISENEKNEIIRMQKEEIEMLILLNSNNEERINNFNKIILENQRTIRKLQSQKIAINNRLNEEISLLKNDEMSFLKNIKKKESKIISKSKIIKELNHKVDETINKNNELIKANNNLNEELNQLKKYIRNIHKINEIKNRKDPPIQRILKENNIFQFLKNQEIINLLKCSKNYYEYSKRSPIYCKIMY